MFHLFISEAGGKPSTGQKSMLFTEATGNTRHKWILIHHPSLGSVNMIYFHICDRSSSMMHAMCQMQVKLSLQSK